MPITETPNRSANIAEYGREIDFNRLLKSCVRITDGAVCTEISGLSGRPLEFHITEKCFELDALDSVDNIRLGFYIHEYHGEKAAFFDIRTRSKTNRIRHPDLNASRFIDFALSQHPESHNITLCRGTWETWSDNYEQFFHGIHNGLSPSQSALATWSGKHFSRNGFTVVPEHEIEIYNCADESRVTVSFRRSTFS